MCLIFHRKLQKVEKFNPIMSLAIQKKKNVLANINNMCMQTKLPRTLPKTEITSKCLIIKNSHCHQYIHIVFKKKWHLQLLYIYIYKIILTFLREY